MTEVHDRETLKTFSDNIANEFRPNGGRVSGPFAGSWTGSKSTRSFAPLRRPTPTPGCARWTRYTWPLLKPPHLLHH